MAPTALTAAQVTAALSDLDGWSGDPTGIARTVNAPGFLAGIRLVDQVAEAAEAMNHHPDIDIRYTKVTFRLSTHSAHGVTNYDIELAKKIDDLARSGA